jgi:cytochrome c-type biogenesis protein CcmH
VRRLLLALALAATAFWHQAPGALAVEPDEILDDPVLEARAREISKNVRCLVCQNESIDSSNAGLARDLRIIIRERLVAGDTDEQVVDFLVARYGDFVLLDPPVKPITYVLWFGPVLILLVGAGGVYLYFARGRRVAAEGAGAPPLSPEEQKRLAKLIREGEREGPGRA